jgi:hypothetical protein
MERKTMKTYAVTVPEIAIVAATRGLGGAGIGLLVAGFLRPDTRRTLLDIGTLSTIPIAMALFGKRETKEETQPLTSANTEAVWHSESVE